MKKKVIIRVAAMLLALLMALGIFLTPALAASNDGVTIKLHYNRPDGVYADWSVWFWNLGAEGVDVPFANEGGEMVATFPVAPGATSVGFIVKLPGWAAKDVNMDQFIDVASFISGTVHVYVESGVEGYEIVLGDDVVSGIKAREVIFKEGIGLLVSMTAAISDADTAFTVTGPEGNLTIASVTA